MTTPRPDITGLVLAGGRSRRMGGADKGLQRLDGQPLAAHALQRLRPQVGPLMLSANRHPADYAALGVPVWPDTLPDHPGPLAGLLAGLTHCRTPWLVSVPCDCPRFPADLVARLAAVREAEGTALAVAASREGPGEDAPVRLHPVFCLLGAGLVDSLADSLARGERRVSQWVARQRASVVVFDDASAFANVNTPDDLLRLGRAG